MKNVVKYWNYFLWYSTSLETYRVLSFFNFYALIIILGTKMFKEFADFSFETMSD